MIYLGADHRGYKLKEEIKAYLKDQKIQFEDLGNTVFDSKDDYPDFAYKVAEKVKMSDDKGIVLCGSGTGVDVVVNKFRGIRSCLGINKSQVAVARQDDDTNVLAIASDYTSYDDAIDMVKSFLTTQFIKEESHIRRIKKIDNIKN